MHKGPLLNLGSWSRLNGDYGGRALFLPAQHLLTHGVVVGMTGSGKTGLVMVLVEEALRGGIPVLVIDVKGDLPNLLLTFPDLGPSRFMPWVSSKANPGSPGEEPAPVLAARMAERHRQALETWGLGDTQLREFHDSSSVRLLTPGASSGEGGRGSRDEQRRGGPRGHAQETGAAMVRGEKRPCALGAIAGSSTADVVPDAGSDDKARYPESHCPE